MLKIKDFKDIFEGITEYIPIHEDLVSKFQGQRSIINFINSMENLIESKRLYEYQSYFTTYEKRMSALKHCLENYPKFLQFHENNVNQVPQLNRKGLDQLFISPIQRIPRYTLLLKELSKYITDPVESDKMSRIVKEMCKMVQFLNIAKHKSEQTEMLFMMQRKVNNFPPDFLRAERVFLTKIACFMVDPNNGKTSKNRLTLYLCNDMLVFAKKRSSISGIVTHDFILATHIKNTQINISRGKKAESNRQRIEIIYLVLFRVLLFS